MVFSWIFTSLVCVLTVGWARSACDQSTLNSEATQNCVKGFYNYISQVMSSVSDPREIATIFCSAEGQSVIECMFPLMEQCPELMANMGDGAMAMPSQADLLKACSQIPSDIGTNKCVKDHFESAAFMECMSKVKTDYKTEVEMKSCGASDARLMCLKESVEKPCGKRYYTALATNADYFLSSNLFTCDRSMSTAPVVRLSAAASLVAVLAALLL
ncbi:hypothetical protein MAR_012974 [Mya arenaria]|uniref:Uncharacterized protein n=1 Tax=Mya arenaria TaxID=6604 RepID=A0ABY7FZ80_MYAAR|nr:hypothetical protein MAR_012974 [Mya arenaria]